MSSYARKADYSKVCVQCENHSIERGTHICSAQRSLISGEQMKQMCTTARSAMGCCGAEGVRFVAKNVVSIGVAKPEGQRIRGRHAQG